MKKFLLTITAALAALAAPAATLNLGPWDNLPSCNAGSTNAGPLNMTYKYSASQVLLTNEQLTDIVPKVTADGTTYAAIKSVSFNFEVNWDYEVNGSCTVKVYCQNVDASSFPKSGAVEQFFPYQDGVTGTATLYGDDDALVNAFNDGGLPCPVTVTFQEPIKYEGKGLVLTFFTENNLEPGMGDLYEGYYEYNPEDGSFHIGSALSDSSMPALTGNLTNSSSLIPIMQFGYEEVTEVNGPTVTEGDPTTTMIGTIDNQGGSVSEQQPWSPDESYSASQAIYTSVDLRGLGVDGNTTKARIDEITFYIPGNNGEGHWGENPSYNVTVYVQNSDATAFEKVGNQYKFFPYQDGVKGTLTVDSSTGEDWNDYMCEGGYSCDVALSATIHLESPIDYEGQSLIFTWFCEGTDLPSMTWSSGTIGFSTGSHQSVQQHGSSMPAMTGTFSTSDAEKFVPTLSFHYTPLTISGGTKTPVVISYDGVSISKCTVPGKGDANNISVAYSIDDPAGCDSYEIRLGTTSLGTVTATSGTVNFLSLPKADLLLSVVPNGENVFGSSVTVPAADIEALFTAPVIDSTVATAIHGSYDPLRHATMDIDAAASVHMTTTVPVATVNFLGSGASMVYPEGGQDADFFKQLVPAGLDNSNANSFEAAGGVFAFYKNNAFKSPVEGGRPTLETLPASLSVRPVARYPIAAAATPTLTATVPSSVTIVTKDVQTATAYRAEIPAETPAEIEIESSLSRIDYICKDGYFIAVIPEGYTMQYCIVNAPAAEPASVSLLADTVADDLDWTDSDDRILTLPHSEVSGADIHVRALDNEGTERHRVDLHIDSDGNISGVSDITADDADTSAEYYDLSGRRVTSPAARGIYIRRTATGASKVVL